MNRASQKFNSQPLAVSIAVSLLATLALFGCHEANASPGATLEVGINPALDHEGSLTVGRCEPSPGSTHVVEAERCCDGRIFVSVSTELAPRHFDVVELFFDQYMELPIAQVKAGWYEGARALLGTPNSSAQAVHGSVTMDASLPTASEAERWTRVIAYDLEGMRGKTSCRFQGKVLLKASDLCVRDAKTERRKRDADNPSRLANS